jgi:hypothetical protein
VIEKGCHVSNLLHHYQNLTFMDTQHENCRNQNRQTRITQGRLINYMKKYSTIVLMTLIQQHKVPMMIHSSRAGPSISRDLQIRQELLVETFPSNLILRGTKRSHVSCLFAGLVFCDFSHLYSYQVLQLIASLWSIRFSNLCAPVMHLIFGFL